MKGKPVIRMCVCCRNRFEKKSLVRFVLEDKAAVIDTTGKREGRGVYLCTTCLHEAKSLEDTGKKNSVMQKVSHMLLNKKHHE